MPELNRLRVPPPALAIHQRRLSLFHPPVLSSSATQFNFDVDVAAGLEWHAFPRHCLTAGYKYHHFSNANLADNPALDSAGFAFTW